MLLKPNELEYVELVSENEEENLLEENTSENSEYIQGRTILLGGNSEPLFIEDEFSFLISNYEESEEDEDVFVMSKPITIGGGDFVSHKKHSGEFDESDFSYNIDDEFGLDDDGLSLYKDAPEYPSEDELEHSLEANLEEESWEKTKHTTLIGKVDTTLLGKIREYRESVREMSEERLSSLSSGEDRNKLLMEASQFEDNPLLDNDEVGQMILELDKKISAMVQKYTQIQKEALLNSREEMLKEVESEIGDSISSQISIIRDEASERIDETVIYYKKKLESDNKLLSDANNIISRREQILDDAYNKTLSILDEAEEKSTSIIERSSQAHEEAELIIAEYEKSGQELKAQAEAEADRIISDANLESARIIQAAEDQHQDIVDAATQDGFSVGYQEGKEEALKENSELLGESLKALNKLYAAFPIAVKQNDSKIVRLAYQIAESVISEPVTERKELEEKIINKGIKVIGDLENVKVKVNPQDLDLLLPKQEYFKLVIPEVSEFIIVGDYTINKGNCVIAIKSEELDISINTQISILEEVFSQALERENSQNFEYD